MENGFTSSRNEGFPAGLRVLVVDDDPTWLKILEKMLKRCSYEVTTCGLARDSLNLLRERKDGYDIVISDVNMPDMDGFKLLEHVGLEMDLPVIMMSVDGETSRVMKGVQHGACDYLLKPIRMKELRNIWQHVFRKRIHEIREIELLEGIGGIQMLRNAWDSHDEANLLYGDDLSSLRKRKDTESRHDEKDTGDNFAKKKARVVWSVDLHQKFVKAVNQIGYDKVGPKKILDLMNVPWLTRENVASHLQKYRLYLTRLQKENDQKNSVSGIKQSDSPSSFRDHDGSVGTNNSITMPRSDISNPSCGFSGSRADSQSNDADRKATLSLPVAEKQVSNQLEFRCPFTPIRSGQNARAFDSSVPIQYTRCEMQAIQAKQDEKSHCMIQLLLPVQQQHIQANLLQPSLPISSGLSISERGICNPTQNSPFYGKQTSSTNHISPAASVADSGCFQINTAAMENYQTFVPSLTDISSFKHLSSNLSRFTDEKIMNQGLLPFPSLDEDLQVPWFHGDCYATNLGLKNVECYDTVPNAELPTHFYDTFRSDFDYPYDPNECFIDQGLFIQ